MTAAPRAAATVAGPRATRQRAAVVEALAESEQFTSAQDLYARLRERGSPVALATVYRTLQSLAERGEVDVVQAGGEQRYRRCAGTAHHHHLVCRECGTTVEVASEAVERWAREVAATHGFVDVEHDVEVYGLCATCAGVHRG